MPAYSPTPDSLIGYPDERAEQSGNATTANEAQNELATSPSSSSESQDADAINVLDAPVEGQTVGAESPRHGLESASNTEQNSLPEIKEYGETARQSIEQYVGMVKNRYDTIRANHEKDKPLAEVIYESGLKLDQAIAEVAAKLDENPLLEPSNPGYMERNEVRKELMVTLAAMKAAKEVGDQIAKSSVEEINRYSEEQNDLYRKSADSRLEKPKQRNNRNWLNEAARHADDESQRSAA